MSNAKRNKLMKLFIDKGMRSDEILPIIVEMEGKEDEDKERIAEEIIGQLNAKPYPPDLKVRTREKTIK